VIAIAAGAMLLGGLIGLAAGAAGQNKEPLAGATSQAVAAESSAADRGRETAETEEPAESPEPTALVVPDDLVGQNAAIAEDQLREMGFTRIEFGSVDPDDTVVILPENWRVVAVEPEPGSEIGSDSLVVLSCTKQP
jgi:hypothetical protein